MGVIVVVDVGKLINIGGVFLIFILFIGIFFGFVLEFFLSFVGVVMLIVVFGLIYVSGVVSVMYLLLSG